jgi:hypothetical protein
MQTPKKVSEYHCSDSYYEKEKQLLSCLFGDKTTSQQKLSVTSASEPTQPELAAAQYLEEIPIIACPSFNTIDSRRKPRKHESMLMTGNADD